MVKYVFHYLNVRGLGECARLILHYAGCEFEDHRMEFAELNKDELPFGKVPVLEVDGKKLPESFAINRYLAKQTGLGGSDDFESAEIDSIAYLWKDFLDAILPFILVVMGRRKGDKEQMREEHLNPALNHYIPIFERLLKESDNGYLHSSGLSWADFFRFKHHIQLPKVYARRHQQTSDVNRPL
ncbi:hypothetical protein M3Y94_00054900 [Aphelenchoides besseyi]|nr:hypothetical protein M3Y94_00054900 [Aphelenchoides besseyi]